MPFPEGDSSLYAFLEQDSLSDAQKQSNLPLCQVNSRDKRILLSYHQYSIPTKCTTNSFYLKILYIIVASTLLVPFFQQNQDGLLMVSGWYSLRDPLIWRPHLPVDSSQKDYTDARKQLALVGTVVLLD